MNAKLQKAIDQFLAERREGDGGYAPVTNEDVASLLGTLSVLCGTPACNASCPFCIAKMTGTTHGVSVAPKNVNWRNLDIACRFAEKAGATTCLITGKGEPTLYPDLVLQYIQRVAEYFPFIEIQSNGIDMVERQKGLEITPPKINHDTLLAELRFDFGLPFHRPL